MNNIDNNMKEVGLGIPGRCNEIPDMRGRPGSGEPLQYVLTALHTILRGVNQAVLVADETGKLIFVNPLAERILRRVSTGDETLVTGWIFRAARGESIEGEETTLPALESQGVSRWRAASLPLLDGEGSVRGGVLFMEDMTFQWEAESLLSALRQLEREDAAVKFCGGLL